MDEQRLAALFRDAVGDPPPASFGRDEVVAASQRATTRRRSALAGGTLLGVAVLAGGLVAGGQVLQGQTSTAARQPTPETDAQPADSAAPHVLGALPGTETPAPRTGAAGGEQAGCGPLDNALAADVTAVLADRGTAVAGPADEVSAPCPDGSRAAALPVAGGTLAIVVIPQAGPPEPVNVTRPDGRHEHARPLDDGRGLVVISMPAGPGRPAPLGDELPELATQLAAWL